MIALGGIGRCTSTLPSLLDPHLECQHRRLLVRLVVNVLLHTIGDLNALLDEVSRIAFSRGTLPGARVAEERPHFALAHHENWDSVSGIGISALHETKVGADRWHARGPAGHQKVLLHERTRLQAMWTLWFVVHMLLQ